MNDNEYLKNSHRPRKRPNWQWLLILGLLLANLIAGLFALKKGETGYIIAVGAISLAFSLHYFDVSVAIHSVRFQYPGEAKLEPLKQLSFRVVNHAMLCLTGGLTVILSVALHKLIPTLSYVAYVLGAVAILATICIYQLKVRRWPEEIENMLLHLPNRD